jgi:hypothetical protein
MEHRRGSSLETEDPGDGVELTPELQIVTFDEGGVSGHLNHQAVSAAVR